MNWNNQDLQELTSVELDQVNGGSIAKDVAFIFRYITRLAEKNYNAETEFITQALGH